ncbi:cytochrome P450 [Coprinopsis marcescibilis]|uniref:Cytochrome P450 n=1 Tax=Coprinopsis marcescibilis TaxID=230819 RepID=A0A5C3L8F1_COPMA|nr:cytochrome P450 [Coprinopsis marcescibilis]
MQHLLSCATAAAGLWLRTIPTVGSDTFVGAYLTAFRSFFSSCKAISDGYRKYRGTAFKVPSIETPSGWMVIVSGPQMIEELRNASPSSLDGLEFLKDFGQVHYTFGKYNKYGHSGPYHTNVIRTGFTRALFARYGDICDELENALDISIPVTKGRDPEFQELQRQYTMNVLIAAGIVHMFPTALKPVAGWAVSGVPRAMKQLHEYLGPMIEERLQRDEEFGGKWEGRPNDMISWLLDQANAEQRTAEDIEYRVMSITFAAVVTTSTLASRQEYLEPLRQEVEAVVSEYGWSKESLSHMSKLDSFMKETARYWEPASVGIARKAMKDFTFSNGVHIPKGVSVVAASHGIHHDPDIYENPDNFDGFRFSDIRETGTEEMDWCRHRFSSPNPNYLIFDYGKQSCPGRFVAATQIKTALAHILVKYDLRLPVGQDDPSQLSTWLGVHHFVKSGTRMEFRERQATV